MDFIESNVEFLGHDLRERSHHACSEFDFAGEYGDRAVLRNSHPGIEHRWVHAVDGEAVALGRERATRTRRS